MKIVLPAFENFEILHLGIIYTQVGGGVFPLLNILDVSQNGLFFQGIVFNMFAQLCTKTARPRPKLG